MTTFNPVGPAALSLPIFKKLANRRVVLASASPRRKEIFANAVRSDPITSLQTMGAGLPNAKRASFLKLSRRLLQKISPTQGSKADWRIIL